MSFLFGSTVTVPLSETTGANTRLYRQKRAVEVARLTGLSLAYIKEQLTAFSKSHVETSMSFVFTDDAFQVAVSGLKTASSSELQLVIDNVRDLLVSNEKFTVGSIPAGLLVSWLVAPEPVVSQTPVVDGQVTEVVLN